MTDDDIIARAKSLGWNVEHAQTNVMLLLFARDVEDQVRYQEREACAQVCDALERKKWGTLTQGSRLSGFGAVDCAVAIRARGEKA